MTEPDVAGHADQPVRLGRPGICIKAEAKRVSGAPQNGRVPDGIRRDQQQQLLSREGRRPDAAQEALLDPARKPSRIREAETAGELVKTQTVRQFEQRQWVAVRLGDNAVPHPGIEAARGNRGEEGAGVGLGQAFDHKPRHPGQRIQRDAGGEQQRKRVRFGAPRDKRECLQGLLVDPLRIVDQTQEGSFGGEI
jgi:hypothetical protein